MFTGDRLVWWRSKKRNTQTESQNMKTLEPKQTTTNSLAAGRIYSFVYVSDVEMVQTRALSGEVITALSNAGVKLVNTVKGSNVVQVNPLADVVVFVRRVVKAQAAGNETYANVQRKLNPDWQPSGDKKWWRVSADNDCIVEHQTKQTRYLRAIPRGIIKEEYFIGAHPCDAAQTAIVQAFKSGATDKSTPAYVLFKTDNIENLQDTTDIIEQAQRHGF